jgi:hypothetical protein
VQMFNHWGFSLGHKATLMEIDWGEGEYNSDNYAK